jgi:hypothetical protein
VNYAAIFDRFNRAFDILRDRQYWSEDSGDEDEEDSQQEKHEQPAESQ